MATFSGLPAVKKTVLLLSGTCEGPPLARALHDAGFKVRATVTRHEALTNLFGSLRNQVEVEVRGFTALSLAGFLSGKGADLVLDATHPFAVRITRIAHAVCAELGVPFVRYERPDWQPPGPLVELDSFAEAAAALPSLGKRAMLTIGAKQLKHFAGLHDRVVLFARVLPSPISLQQALDAGFSGERVMCLRPPFSRELNRALFAEYRADILVTKASGPEGGVVEKVLAAHELGMKVLMIRRPLQTDIPFVDSLEAAVGAVRERLKHGV